MDTIPTEREIPRLDNLSDAETLLSSIYSNKIRQLVTNPGIIHMTLCYKPHDSNHLYTVVIDDKTVKSEWDWFILNMGRGTADAVLYGGSTQRKEDILCFPQGRPDIVQQLNAWGQSIRADRGLQNINTLPNNDNNSSIDTAKQCISYPDICIISSLLDYDDDNDNIVPLSSSSYQTLLFSKQCKLDLTHKMIATPLGKVIIFTTDKSYDYIMNNIESILSSSSSSNVHPSWITFVNYLTQGHLQLASPRMVTTLPSSLSLSTSSSPPLPYLAGLYLSQLGYNMTSIEAGPHSTRQIYTYAQQCLLSQSKTLSPSTLLPSLLFLTIYIGPLPDTALSSIVSFPRHDNDDDINHNNISSPFSFQPQDWSIEDCSSQRSSHTYCLPSFSLPFIDQYYKLVTTPFRPYGNGNDTNSNDTNGNDTNSNDNTHTHNTHNSDDITLNTTTTTTLCDYKFETGFTICLLSLRDDHI